MRASILIVLLGLVGFPQQPPQHNTVSPADLYKMASPSVVLIEIYGNDGKVSGNGSGFIVSADGVILTNYHVIAHTKRATVRLANGDAYDDVSVLDLDKRKDIALVKIKAVDLPPLKLGRSGGLQVGDTLYALGNPLGVFQNTLSEGILSGIRQGDGYKLFQLSTPISHGSSGSPVFDSHGDVVGIIELTVEEGQNLNFAIPIDYAAGMLASRAPRSLESVYEPPEPAPPSEAGAVAPPQPAATGQPSEALKSDPLDYLPQKLGLWTLEDAEKELGQPYMRRDALNGTALIGDIYKYKSPASGFTDVELNFSRNSKRLGAIYFYPRGVVAWQTIRARMGHRYKKQKGQNGTAFYVYQVLQHQTSIYVDSLDNVISIGIW